MGSVDELLETHMTLGSEQARPPSDQAGRGQAAQVRTGAALFVIATAQLMVLLDNTVMNVALPSIQADLGVSPSALSWIVTAYALTFGGLLLLGGRAGDLFGRRRMFRIGLLTFTLASLLGGIATSGEVLIAARALQGVGGAIIAPTALSLIATTFPEGKPRNRALGVYAAMGGVGSTLGLLLGGVLTDLLSWHWVLWLNVPIGVAALLGTRVLGDGQRNGGRLDVLGAIVGTAGLTAFVYAATLVGERGVANPGTLAFFAAAAVLLAAFVIRQRNAVDPMLPLRLFGDRNRVGAYATMLFVGAGMFGTSYFLTLYMQQVLDLTPVQTGVAFLPFTLGMVIATMTGSRVLARFDPRRVAGPGLATAAVGMFWFSTLEPGSSYLFHLAPAMFVTALGIGSTVVPMTLGAVRGVPPRDSGIASATLNTTQQIGGAIGLAVLSSVAASVTSGQLQNADAALVTGRATGDAVLVQRAAQALSDGYTTSFAVVSALIVTALLLLLTLSRSRGRSGAEG